MKHKRLKMRGRRKGVLLLKALRCRSSNQKSRQTLHLLRATDKGRIPHRNETDVSDRNGVKSLSPGVKQRLSGCQKCRRESEWRLFTLFQVQARGPFVMLRQDIETLVGKWASTGMGLPVVQDRTSQDKQVPVSSTVSPEITLRDSNRHLTSCECGSVYTHQGPITTSGTCRKEMYGQLFHGQPPS